MQTNPFYLILFLWTSLLQYPINAKIYSRCEIATELKKQNFPMSFISSCK